MGALAIRVLLLAVYIRAPDFETLISFLDLPV